VQTLANQSDYEEALRFVAASDRKILRVTISPAAKVDRSRVPSTVCGRPFSGSQFGPLQGLLEMAKTTLPDLLSNPALRSMAEGLLQSNSVKIVQPFACDCCNANISGDRFNSTVRPDFDLCKACMESAKGQELEKEHRFKRVTALEALVATLSNGGTFDAFFAPGSAAPEPVAIHYALCDVCNQTILGVRHKCLDCADYDLCNVCRTRPAPHAQGHVFFSIVDPAVRQVPVDVMAQHKTKRDLEEAARREAAASAAAAESARRAAESRAAEEAQRKEEDEAAARKAAEIKAAEEARKVAEIKAAEEAKAREVALLTKLVPPPVASAPPAEPENEPSAFELNLQTLESMGFRQSIFSFLPSVISPRPLSDRKRNIQILVRNRNKLFESIQELLG
jgi:hypothetical protein